ncbi:MAG: hypothetical protein CO108_10690 [Deltaproteobacteria bacterium CG_4_9_14_3_um_filter_63_12]|nr:MAG: hypothetical protein CO108_10690 [Deltaproteobacteria bacterium CG_4_9_14_3_um_filter_63_12]
MHASPSMEKALSTLVSRAMSAKMRADGKPFVVGLFVTHKCMCSCASCLWRHNDWDDVPAEELKRFLREAKEEGFAALAVSGGEPFLRKDLGELLRFVKEELEMPILVFTTGWLVKSRGAEILPYVDVLMMSIDAPTAARHDEIRGLPGLFDRLMEAAEIVKTDYPQISLQFNSCIQKGVDTEHIDDLIELTEERGLRISFDVITESRNAGDDTTFTETDMGLSTEELSHLCAHLLERKRSGAPVVNSDLYFQYFVDGRKGYHCHFPKLAMMIDGRGNVEDCLQLNTPIANIRNTSVKDILQLQRFRELRKAAESCSTCSSPTMVDMSHVWENPRLMLQRDGVVLG